jgi:transposase
MLAYKAEEAGGWVRKAPARNTSQKCAACGAMPAKKVTLDVRTYECASCGHTADRDVNAAMNILAVGLMLDRPGGTYPVRRMEADECGAGRKAGHRAAAQNDIRRLAA